MAPGSQWVGSWTCPLQLQSQSRDCCLDLGQQSHMSASIFLSQNIIRTFVLQNASSVLSLVCSCAHARKFFAGRQTPNEGASKRQADSQADRQAARWIDGLRDRQTDRQASEGMRQTDRQTQGEADDGRTESGNTAREDNGCCYRCSSTAAAVHHLGCI